MAETKHYKAGEIIFRENEIPKCMYIIKSGCVVIQKRSPSGKSVEIAKLLSNEVLGELSFFDRRPRSASAVAHTDVELLPVDFEGLDKVYANVPPYIKTIMAAVAERLRRANETIRRLQHGNDDPGPE